MVNTLEFLPENVHKKERHFSLLKTYLFIWLRWVLTVAQGLSSCGMWTHAT